MILKLICVITIIQNDISDVNQIFKELGTLVHRQGEVIDSIEANVQITNVSVQEATSQLRRATDYTVSKQTLFHCFY